MTESENQTRYIGCRATSDLIGRLDRAASNSYRTRSEFIIYAVEQALALTDQAKTLYKEKSIAATEP